MQLATRVYPVSFQARGQHHAHLAPPRNGRGQARARATIAARETNVLPTARRLRVQPDSTRRPPPLLAPNAPRGPNAHQHHRVQAIAVPGAGQRLDRQVAMTALQGQHLLQRRQHLAASVELEPGRGLGQVFSFFFLLSWKRIKIKCRIFRKERKKKKNKLIN